MKKFRFSASSLLTLCLLVSASHLFAQTPTITKPDGSPIEDQYCWDDTDYQLVGSNGPGTFDGCGIFFENGQWFFNPQVATEGETVFPIQCQLTYTDKDGQSTSRYLLIWKPVVITPPLVDSFTCNGMIRLEAYTLYAGAYDYQWTPAAPLQRPDTSITNGFITETTTFVITAVDHTSGCIGSDTVVIEKYPEPDLIVSGDTIINARGTVQLEAEGADYYVWRPRHWLSNDSISNPVANPQQPVTYTVIGTNEYGCSDTAEIRIDIREDIFIPNAFTPNGDGVNDLFRIENFGYQQLVDFRVYNRWGQLMFTGNEGAQGWDGTFNGNAAPQDTYFYYIKFVSLTGEPRELKGDLMLIR